MKRCVLFQEWNTISFTSVTLRRAQRSEQRHHLRADGDGLAKAAPAQVGFDHFVEEKLAGVGFHGAPRATAIDPQLLEIPLAGSDLGHIGDPQTVFHRV